MSVSANELVQRMYSTALGYRSGEERISQGMADCGHSAPILGILALEILLKAVRLSLGVNSKKSHDLRKLWSSLDSRVQDDILCRAKKRYGNHANLEDIDRILDDLTKVFLKGRYDYEINQHLSDKEVEKKGADWLEADAPLGEADLCFWPLEKDALIIGAAQYLQEYLGLDLRDVFP